MQLLRTTRRIAGAAAGLALSGALVSADTLVLRNGNRVQGRLISIRNGVIEFEQERGFGERTVRVDQEDVRTIEFDRDQGRDRDRDNSWNGGSGAPGERPRGMRERELQVSARRPWTDTGISLRNGQTIYIQAAGRVRWGPSRQDGPEGESGSPRNPGRPIPSRPGAGLIGRVGDEAPFFIGREENGIRVRGTGTLFLGINDDFFEDNSGEFRVVVYY